MNSAFFKILRESNLPVSQSGSEQPKRGATITAESAKFVNILMVGGHSRQIQDISSIARSLSGGGIVHSVSSLEAAQENILRGQSIDWIVAAIRPFDTAFIVALGRLHDRLARKSDARWMALWPGLRPPEHELINWNIHLSYPASVGQMRRAFVEGSAEV